MARSWTLIALCVIALAPDGGAAPATETGFLDRTVAVKGVTYRYQVYLPDDYDASKTYPVILFLHGAGERGDDGLLQTQVGLGAAVRLNRHRFPFIVVFPQARRETLWIGDMAAQALVALDRTLQEFRGDSRRTYLAGLSMGGYGTWLVAAQNPGRFAAIVPICGWVTLPSVKLPDDRAGLLRESNPFLSSENPYAAAASKIGKTPTWIFHGAADPVVSVDESRKMSAALKELGGDVRYNEYEGVSHNSWDRAFAEAELVPWLLSHRLPER
ncbi:MAG: alpha/beta hydrolase-fold protein [bacterium]